MLTERAIGVSVESIAEKSDCAWLKGRHFALLLLLIAPISHAFPPYRSTDGSTAGPGVIEFRLGLLRLERRDSATERTTPLTRTNVGVGDHYEIVTEFEYSPSLHETSDGALGFKWARRDGDVGVAVETLILIPVHSGQSGSGIESQFIATSTLEQWQIHFNAGGFVDSRSRVAERGWRGSVLAEFGRGRSRPGLELFGRKAHSGSARVQAGLGVITQLKRLQIRSGLHFGLSRAAPDVEVNVWLAWNWNTMRK